MYNYLDRSSNERIKPVLEDNESLELTKSNLLPTRPQNFTRVDSLKKSQHDGTFNMFEIINARKPKLPNLQSLLNSNAKVTHSIIIGSSSVL